MTDQPTGAINVLAQARTADAQVQIVNYHFFAPADGTLRGDGKFHLDLCLTTRHRTARARYRDVWKPQHFAPVGDLYVIHPDADIIAKSDEVADMTSVVCQLDPEPVMDLFDVVPEPTDPLLTASLDVRSDKLKCLMRWMAEEVKQPGFSSALMLDLMLAQVRLEMVRHGDLIQDDNAQGGLAPWRLKLIEERLSEAGAPPALAELAALCRLSVRQLSRGFRASKGCSLGAYVVRRQCDHAKRMLTNDHSITLIAEQLGFATASGFCAAFRREAGLTPGQYRARLLRPN